MISSSKYPLLKIGYKETIELNILEKNQYYYFFLYVLKKI